MKRHSCCVLCVLALSSILLANAQSPDPILTPLPGSTVDYNTSAPAANASVTTVMPPETLTSSSELQNVTFSSIGTETGATASQFNASIPLQTDSTTVAPLETFNTSVASLLPDNATSATNDSNTLLIADPSWGKEIVVSASSLNTTQLVVSNATDLGSTTAFTTVYNTTTVSSAHSPSCAPDIWLSQQHTVSPLAHCTLSMCWSSCGFFDSVQTTTVQIAPAPAFLAHKVQLSYCFVCCPGQVVQNDDTEAYPWQHSVCTATFQEQSMWQDLNGTYNASVKVIVRSTILDDTMVPWTLSLASAGGYSGAESTYGLANVTVANGTVAGEVVGADQTLLAQAGNAPNFDLLVASSFVNFAPVNVTVNGNSCAIIIDSNVTTEPLPNVTSSSVGGASTESAAGLTTRNGQITDLDGNALVFKGLNWFGFDDGNTGPDGLWAGSASTTLDFANIMLRIKALGFNAVRLPFSFKVSIRLVLC